MAFDPDLADRITVLLAGDPGMTQRRMFGGLAFLVDARMAVCAARSGGLMVRVDPAGTGSLVAQAHVERMEMHGRSLDGWLVVGAAATASDDALRAWVERGVTYARSLPAKGSPRR